MLESTGKTCADTNGCSSCTGTVANLASGGESDGGPGGDGVITITSLVEPQLSRVQTCDRMALACPCFFSHRYVAIELLNGKANVARTLSKNINNHTMQQQQQFVETNVARFDWFVKQRGVSYRRTWKIQVKNDMLMHFDVCGYNKSNRTLSASLTLSYPLTAKRGWMVEARSRVLPTDNTAPNNLVYQFDGLAKPLPVCNAVDSTYLTLFFRCVLWDCINDVSVQKSNWFNAASLNVLSQFYCDAFGKLAPERVVCCDLRRDELRDVVQLAARVGEFQL